MLAAVAPLPPELIGTEVAAGRTLADTLQAARAQPPFRSAAMDGYGVRAADLALGRFTVLGEALAGKGYAGGPVGTSGAVRIFTGAPVPDGVDVVVPQERARREGETVWLDVPAPLRTNIRAAGIDFKVGDLLVRGGTRLHAGHVALIAAAGIGSVSVTRQPRVAVLATGNEIVQPGARAAAGQIFDSVSFGLGAMIADWGGKPVRIAARKPMISIPRCTTRLLSCAMSGGISAMRFATRTTSSPSCASGKARLAHPSSTACTPEIESPVSIISMAARMPHSHAWKCMSGTPKRTAG